MAAHSTMSPNSLINNCSMQYSVLNDLARAKRCGLIFFCQTSTALRNCSVFAVRKNGRIQENTTVANLRSRAPPGCFPGNRSGPKILRAFGRMKAGPCSQQHYSISSPRWRKQSETPFQCDPSLLRATPLLGGMF